MEFLTAMQTFILTAIALFLVIISSQLDRIIQLMQR